MSGPPLLTALAAASAVSILVFLALSRVADTFGGARQRRVLRLTEADSPDGTRSPTDLAGQVGSSARRRRTAYRSPPAPGERAGSA